MLEMVPGDLHVIDKCSRILFLNLTPITFEGILNVQAATKCEKIKKKKSSLSFWLVSMNYIQSHWVAQDDLKLV